MHRLHLLTLLVLAPAFLDAQTTAPKPPARTSQTAPPPATPNRANILRGAYGPDRANNDLLYYHLTLRVDPVAKTIAGHNLIRFKMLEDGRRIQIDLAESLAIDKIVFGKETLHYTRDSGAVFLDFPHTLKAGQTYAVDFFYSGTPVSSGRFGDFTFSQDPAGRPWIFTSDEDNGASTWWPSKDQWRDEPQEGMDFSIAVPDALMDVSNGRFVSKIDLHDGYTQWNWHVSYPINSYDVALNIGAYTHFSETYTNAAYPPLSLDFYCLPEDLDKAKVQFAQAKGMLDAFEHYFGEYPFARDGYKLVQVPYSGMEHQSAVAYGNGFDNGYLHRDWTGVGISPRFDFIIIHESGHEWFGNAVSAADRADMWIHEGFTTYLETLFVEYQYGRADALLYTSGLVPKVMNRVPIVGERGVNADPPQDQYFKGALMIATLRSMLAADGVADDKKWFALLHDFYQHLKYQNIMTEDVIAWWSNATGRNLAPFFNQYLRHTAIPALELSFDASTHTVLYKWQADEPGFAMPIQVGDPAHWQTIHPTQQWQVLSTPLTVDEFQVATGLFYINVSKT
jgi:aminopeptidase N